MSFPRIALFLSVFLLAALVLPLSVTAATGNGRQSIYAHILQKLHTVDPDTISYADAKKTLHDLKLLAKQETLHASLRDDSSKATRQLTDWEQRLAQQLKSTGQSLDGASLDEAGDALLDGGKALLPDGSGVAQSWMQDNLRSALPQTDNKMLEGAKKASINEIARGSENMARGYGSAQIGLTDEYNLGTNLKQTALRTGLEGIKGAAAASEVYMLNHLELDYSLSGGGVESYSALTVQPLWSSESLQHNLFAQASVLNTKVSETGTNTNMRRDTVNAGLAYRYIMPDEKHMFGANAFFDHQWPYHHNRMSLGLDYKNSLYGVAFNKYIALSDWRRRGDGYEEKALGGEDLEFSGRLKQAPELELFVKGYHWAQERTAILNMNGDDIWGYQFAAEYTPVNALSIRSEITKDNEMDNLEGQITMRFNYTFGQGWNDLWERPSYNLESVVDRRFEKVSRTNEIRVQTRQALSVTASVTFAQGANVSAGESLVFGTTVTTSGSAGDAVTVAFGNGARLDMGQSTQVTLEEDQIVLLTGIMQFTSATGGIKVITVPNGTINLIGTDVDVSVAGSTTILRVRDGAADFKDETGTTRVNEEELAESQSGDSAAPQIRAESSSVYTTHTGETHSQLDLVGPVATVSKAAPYAKADVSITGIMGVGQTLTFTVPLSRAVIISGSPQLAFTLGGLDRTADYTSGSGTTALTFTYTVISADETLSTIITQKIVKNGGSLTCNNGAPMVLTLSGSQAGTVPDDAAPTITALTTITSGSDPAGVGDVITVTLDATETLIQNGSPTLTLNLGGVSQTASFSSITSGNAVFTYTIQTGDGDTDGVEITAINAAAGELADAYGNDLDVTYTLPDNTGINVTTLLGLSTCPSGDLSAPTNSGCARLFGSDPTSLDDVMVYAGDVPGTSTDFFVRRCDLGMTWSGTACTGTRATMKWKDSTTDSVITRVTTGTDWTDVNAADGEALTTQLVADASGLHAAAETCNNLPNGGWYLPAISELDVMYANLIATDDPDHPLSTVNNSLDGYNAGTTGPLRDSFTTTGSWYGSSSETSISYAWAQQFNHGNQAPISKVATLDVRCARR